MKIRLETPEDRDPIRRLTRAAFSDSELGYHGEAELIDAVRTSCECLSLVADDERGQVTGHVLFSPVTLQTDGRCVTGMGLRPMAVRSDRQRSGIGSALVTHGVEQLFAAQCPFIVVLGHPDFYARFGFQPAAQLGVFHGFAGIPQELFLIRFHPDSSPHHASGRARYEADAFGPQFA